MTLISGQSMSICMMFNKERKMKMERQYKLEMTITVDDEVLGNRKEGNSESSVTVEGLVLESLNEAPFQVDCLSVR